ncbi:MAG: DUF4197 domain-containing protein [Sediminibacterium sp.]
MKRILIAAFAFCTMGLSSCSTLSSLSNYLTEADATNALREALSIGANMGANSLGQKGSFSRDVLLNAVLPQEVQKVVSVLDRLGLATEFNRFTNTLDDAAVNAALKSAPIFVDGIRHMSIRDAIGIVKNGGTAGTDYLRRTVGDSLRNAVSPVMRNALNQYSIVQQWDKLVAPAKLLLGNKVALNLDLDHILAVMLTNEMFKKIEQQEINIRTNAQARTSSTLQRVFGKDWNTSSTAR